MTLHILEFREIIFYQFDISPRLINIFFCILKCGLRYINSGNFITFFVKPRQMKATPLENFWIV